MSGKPAKSVEFLSHNPDQTRKLGIQLGRLLQIGDMICLQGELGAGKTTFVQGLASGWGSRDPVTSPTFVLVNVYHRKDGKQFFHFDTYRLETIPEAEELDLEGMLGEGPLVIEWPEKIQKILPVERLWIKLEDREDDLRQLTFSPVGNHYASLLSEYNQMAFGSG